MIRNTTLFFILVFTLLIGNRSSAAIQCAGIFSAENRSPEVQKSIDDTISALAELKLSLDQAQVRGAGTVQGLILANDYVAKENEFAAYLQKENIMTRAELIAQIKTQIKKEQVRKNRKTKKEEAQRRHQEMILYRVFDGREAKFHEIRPGSFNFGPPGQQTPFTFKKPFAMMATVVTQTIWEQVAIRVNQLKQKQAIIPKPSNYPGEVKPVVNIKHSEVMEWIEALNFLAKEEDPLIGQLFPEHQEGDTYRLPKEVEWEFVVRSRGLRNQKHNFGDASKINDYAWINYEGTPRGNIIQEVALKKPILVGKNPFYDMYGNVEEYVLDGYISDDYIVLRGGSIIMTADQATSYSQTRFHKDNAPSVVGFRLVRERAL